MIKSNTLVSFCASRIAPVAAALVLAWTGGNAMAAGELAAKLSPSFIPTVKVGTTVQKAKAADLLEALSLALADNPGVTAADIATQAFATDSTGKARADKDKIAAQVIATAVAARNLSTDGADLSALTAAVFNVNSSSTKAALTVTGKAGVLAAALKSAGTPAVANAIGGSISTAFTGDTTALTTLLSTTATALGTSAPATTSAIENFTAGLFAAGEVARQDQPNFTLALAEKVAAKSPASAGAFYGGLVLNNPGGIYPAGLSSLGSQVVGDKKLAKAIGEILGDTMSGANMGTLSTSLFATPKLSAASKLLVAQGLLRASATADVGTVITNYGPISDKAKFAAVAAVGTVDSSTGDTTKLNAIVGNLATGLSDALKDALGLAVVNAIGTATPAAAADVVTALGFGSDGARQSFGTTEISKVKNLAAAGYLAAGIIGSSTGQSATNNSNAAAALIAKNSKAATDIAQKVSALTSSGPSAAFAGLLANTASKSAQGVAVGVSLTDPADAGAITLAVVTHAGGTDKAALAKVATIAGAVATAVDEEAAADVGAALASKMSNLGKSTGLPIKLSSATALATALAKAIQAKPGVQTANRMDELGEVAAAITAKVLGLSTTPKAESSLIVAIGSAVLKSLSKTAVLSGNPNSSAEALLVAKTQSLKADLWEARDIAGSIAETIKTFGTAAQQTALLGSGGTAGPLEIAFQKLAGKKGSATYTAVHDAFQAVLAVGGNGAAIFETGSVSDKETDTKNG